MKAAVKTANKSNSFRHPTVLIAEDDRKISHLIKLYLEHEGYEVLSAFDGQEALALARTEQPALIILDLMLPHIDGIEICRKLRAESDVYIIMLTAKSTETDKLSGLNSGADDYVTKPFSARELVARVKAFLRRLDDSLSIGSDLEELIIADLIINFRQHQVFLGGELIYLTRNEFCLLAALARSPNRVFTRSELVEKSFGYNYEGLDRTIDTHIKNLRRKIEDTDFKSSKIVTVYGVGYKFSLTGDVS